MVARADSNDHTSPIVLISTEVTNMVQKILPEARFQVVQYPIQEIDGSAKGVCAPDSRFLFEDGLLDFMGPQEPCSRRQPCGF